jgi:FtsZ-binding cell division protein ZapB
MVEETLEAKLKRHEDALSLCMAEIEKLRAENACLRANASAHQTLQSIYRNEAEPSTTRVRAAQAALSHESAPLKPVEAPLDLVAEPIIPLSELVEKQRARARALQALPMAERAALIPGLGGNGNGNGNSDDSLD